MTAVVIVGAGAAGQATARALAEAGVASTVLDRSPERLETLRTELAGEERRLIACRLGAVFHAEAAWFWLWNDEGVEHLAWTQLVLATGASDAVAPDPGAGTWMQVGSVPDNRLAAALGCVLTFNPSSLWLAPALEEGSFETSVANVWVAGSARRPCDEPLAVSDGKACAAAIAARLGGKPPVRVSRLDVARSEPAWIWPDGGAPPDDFVICPCNAVSAGEARQAVRAGADTLHHLGQFSGAGVGGCRGRQCQLALAKMISEETGRGLAEILTPPAEFPAIAVPLRDFAAITPQRPTALPLLRDEGRL